MKPRDLVEMRYKYAGIAASDNSGALYKAAAKDVLDLLERIEFYQDEIDRRPADTTRNDIELETCPKCGSGHAPSLTHLCPRDVTQDIVEGEKK
jgi:hypothetical protein